MRVPGSLAAESWTMKGLTGECLRRVRKCVFPLWQMGYVQGKKASGGYHIRNKPWWRNEFSEIQ